MAVLLIRWCTYIYARYRVDRFNAREEHFYSITTTGYADRLVEAPLDAGLSHQTHVRSMHHDAYTHGESCRARTQPKSPLLLHPIVTEVEKIVYRHSFLQYVSSSILRTALRSSDSDHSYLQADLSPARI